MEITTMNTGAVTKTGAYPRVWNSSTQSVIRRLASTVPAIQGMTLSAAGFGHVGDAAMALATPKRTTPFIDVLSFRILRPPV